MSYKVEVIADNSGQWASNGLCFATFSEAEDYASLLFRCWTSVREWRVVETNEPVTEETNKLIHARAKLN